MRRRIADYVVPFWCFWMISIVSCTRAHEPLALDSHDPSHDGRAIAVYHANEAMTLGKKAENVADQATAYGRLFGPESEWVVGATLLAQYYEEEAKEKARAARRYRDGLNRRTVQGDVTDQ